MESSDGLKWLLENSPTTTNSTTFLSRNYVVQQFALCNVQVDVNGDKAAPIYKFLKSSKGGLFGDGIKWNFAKFLVDKDGNVVDRYAPTTSPLGIEKDLKKLLVVNYCLSKERGIITQIKTH